MKTLKTRIEKLEQATPAPTAMRESSTKERQQALAELMQWQAAQCAAGCTELSPDAYRAMIAPRLGL
jgi:hypothetical protein